MPDGHYIGVDLGGTNLAVARFSEGKIVSKNSFPTGAGRDARALLGSLTEAIESVWDRAVAAIGIGMPGIMDPESGEVLLINNIPSLKGTRPGHAVSDHFGVPAFQSNDANCFALGEAWFGAAKEFRHLVGITLGTGLGAGIVIGKKIYSGLWGGAGELGCLPFRDGIVEDYCSGEWLRKEYGKSGEELFTRAEEKDPVSMEAFHQLGANLGEFLRIVMFALAPQAVVFGGSLSAAWKYIEKGIREEMAGFPVRAISENMRIFPSSLENGGLYGAAALCMTQQIKAG